MTSDTNQRGESDENAETNGTRTESAVFSAISRSGGELRVVKNEKLVLSAPTVASLIEKVEKLGSNNPLRLNKDGALSLFLSDSERASVLGGVQPSESLSEWLRGNEIEDLEPISDPLFDSGNRVDGSPWGWLQIGPDEDWIFAPLTDHRSPARAHAWMSESMTGARIDTGIWCWGATVLYWRTDDSGTAEYRIDYDVADWDLLLNKVYGNLLDGMTLCPTCEEEDYTGWEISVDASPVFADSVIGSALTSIWWLCEDHRGRETFLEAADREWQWSGNSWGIRSKS